MIMNSKLHLTEERNHKFHFLVDLELNIITFKIYFDVYLITILILSSFFLTTKAKARRFGRYPQGFIKSVTNELYNK